LASASMACRRSRLEAKRRCGKSLATFRVRSSSDADIALATSSSTYLEMSDLRDCAEAATEAVKMLALQPVRNLRWPMTDATATDCGRAEAPLSTVAAMAPDERERVVLPGCCARHPTRGGLLRSVLAPGHGQSWGGGRTCSEGAAPRSRSFISMSGRNDGDDVEPMREYVRWRS